MQSESINPLVATKALYHETVGTLSVDGWVVAFGAPHRSAVIVSRCAHSNLKPNLP